MGIKPEVEVNNPNAGKITVIVSGPMVIKSDDPKVVVIKKG